MFFHIILERNMQLHPRHFGARLRDKLVSKLMKDVEGTCSGRHGFVVAIMGIEHVGKGLIRDGAGFVTFPVKYKCVVFRPFKGEILEAVVTMVNKMGFFAEAGPVQIFVSNHLIPDDMEFQSGDTPNYTTSDGSVKIQKDSEVRLKIIGTRVDATEIVYIAYMGPVREEYLLSSDYHLGFLQQALASINAEEYLIRSYRRSFNGFAAKLTHKESEDLKRMEGVVSVFPRTLELQTTRSWDFMGFSESAHKDVSAESNIIVGVIDSGIWPELPSFNDDGFGPPPAKWKGVCKGGQNFTCNNKLIGARSYVGDARDRLGHGCHTASTAAGRKVDDASFYSIAGGTARGGVPSARIAAYKVCDETGCDESAILAAFDDAIADGVDVITISVGGPATEIKYDSIAIGAFHAMDKGILTVQSAGNSGNTSGSVGSIAPWLFTVAASSIDRQIIDKVVLGNNKILIGNSVNSFILKGDKFPLVYGRDCSSLCQKTNSRLVNSTICLDPKLIKGKILVCDEKTGVGFGLMSGALGVVALNTTSLSPCTRRRSGTLVYA